jgi:putative redox protein
MDAIVSWNTKLTFTGNSRGLETVMDTTFANGGLNRGPSPKEIVLQAMCACAGIDVIAILEKSKHLPLTLDMSANAEQTKTTPAVFEFVHIVFKATGDTSEKDLLKAVELSMTKYCGVTAMITKVCPVTYDVFLNGNKVSEGIAKFNI